MEIFFEVIVSVVPITSIFLNRATDSDDTSDAEKLLLDVIVLSKLQIICKTIMWAQGNHWNQMPLDAAAYQNVNHDLGMK